MKVLVFGATGHLGKEIVKALKQQGYDFAVVVRNKDKANELSSQSPTQIVADVTNKNALSKICVGYDVVISALGKSVSPNDDSKPSFKDVDLDANTTILDEALKSGVKKFVYVSALLSENYQHLEYFRVHHEFSERLKASGLNYAIIKPPAIFSAFIDLIDMAKKGRLMTMGTGEKKTNPIYEGDLAKICVKAIKENHNVIEAGGKEIFTRKEINELIQKISDPSKKVRSVPIGLVTLGLPLMKFLNRNAYDKFAFFTEVMRHDAVAPLKGEMKLESYLKLNVKN